MLWNLIVCNSFDCCTVPGHIVLNHQHNWLTARRKNIYMIESRMFGWQNMLILKNFVNFKRKHIIYLAVWNKYSKYLKHISKNVLRQKIDIFKLLKTYISFKLTNCQSVQVLRIYIFMAALKIRLLTWDISHVLYHRWHSVNKRLRACLQLNTWCW